MSWYKQLKADKIELGVSHKHWNLFDNNKTTGENRTK